MKHFLLTAAGPDRPGIVAAVSEILFKLGCNLEDSAMTRLRGEFAILLMFSAPPRTPAAALQRRLKAAARTHRLSLQLKPLSARDIHSPPAPRSLCLVTVYGGDRPGIVYRVAEILAKQRVNITDLTTHRTEAKPGPGYILYVEGELPAGLTTAGLESVLRQAAENLSVTISVKSAEPAAL